MSTKSTGLLVISVVIALSVLGMLLTVATSPDADRLRLAASHIKYLESGVQTVTTVVDQSVVSGERIAAHEVPLTQLDSSLIAGSDALAATLKQVYQPQTPLAQSRKIGFDLLNWRDVDTPFMSDREATTEQAGAFIDDINALTEQFAVYREEQIQFASTYAQTTTQTNQLLTALREQGAARTADAIYVVRNKIEVLFSAPVGQNLDQVLELNGQLEALEPTLPRSLRASLRRQIDAVYSLNAMQRNMTQTIDTMNAAGLLTQLARLNNTILGDQHYISGAVADARILLNVSTVLLLALLAFFGRRLQSSYAALNASHDDLEARVVERTSDLAQANEDLKESQVQLVQAEKMSSLGQLVAGVMHEINTPLLYVQNNTTMTAEAVEEISEFVNLSLPLLSADSNDEVQAILSTIAEQRDKFMPHEIRENLEEVSSLSSDSLEGIGQISELVQSLKDFSRLDRVADDKFDVRDGIEKTLVITRNLLKQGVRVECSLDQVPEIYCSPSRLNQVFINLVTNAVQAMDGEGKLNIETRWLHKGQDDESVEISFADTGCGIPEEHLSKIMDPFFTTKPVGQGTGLGLSIVCQIVEQHAGQILIDSKVGVGTRITLNFPTQTPARTTQDVEAA